ncbi:NUDIX hydrolase [Breoghania sp.]|uniref:NUDIX hydrolase n=1 Tax=Breoghania sp. TaxID=2065378 RepID=UPI003204D3B6
MNSILKVVSAVIRPATLEPATPMKRKRQFATLPFRNSKGKLEVLLVTSREMRRWIIPKGWPKKSMVPHKLAMLEAYEEAGVRGKIELDEIGHYDYVKRLDDRHDVMCRVGIFPMKVKD